METRRRLRRAALPLFAALIALVVVLQGGDGGGRSPVAAASDRWSCGATYDSRRGGPDTSLAWAATVEASGVFERLHEILVSTGLIVDLRVHFGDRTIVIVADPGATLDKSTVATITGLAESIGAHVEVVVGCASMDQLEAAASAARDASAAVLSAEDLRDSGFAISVDAARGRVVIEAPPGLGVRIVDAMKVGADLVDVVDTEVAFASRLVDPPPFFGGARFTTFDSGAARAACTTGFGAVYSGFGTFDVMTTAAHCGAGGASPMGAYNSGWLIGLFGVDGAFASYTWPGPSATYGRDVAMLRTSGVAYSSTMYADPGSTSRVVTSFGDAYTGTPVCTNGSTTLSSCSSLPADFNSTLCAYAEVWAATKCVWVVRFSLYGGVPVQGGDSGGTVFQQVGPSSAKVNGVITGSSGAGSTFVTPVSFFGLDGVTPKT